MEQMGYLAESRILLGKGAFQEALEAARLFQDTSIVPENKFYLSRYYDRLYEAHKGLGNFDSALVYHELKYQHDANSDVADAAQALENFEAEKRALQDSLEAASTRQEMQEAHDLTVKNKTNKETGLLLAHHSSSLWLLHYIEGG